MSLNTLFSHSNAFMMISLSSQLEINKRFKEMFQLRCFYYEKCNEDKKDTLDAISSYYFSSFSFCGVKNFGMILPERVVGYYRERSFSRCRNSTHVLSNKSHTKELNWLIWIDFRIIISISRKKHRMRPRLVVLKKEKMFSKSNYIWQFI